MNMFWLDLDPTIAARWNQDAHVVKMPLEGAQMMCAAFAEPVDMVWRALDPASRLSRGQLPYEWSNPNHPVSLWVRATLGNFRKTGEFMLALLDEHAFRYGGSHKTRAVVEWALANEASASRLVSRDLSMTPPVKMVGDADALAGDVAEAYKAYYLREKQGHWRKSLLRRELVWVKATWRRRGPPSWWREAPPPKTPTAAQLVRLNLKTIDGWMIRQ